MRTLLGTLAAVGASLAVPVVYVAFVWYVDTLPGEEGANSQFGLMLALLLPGFAALLALYHSLGALIARRIVNHRMIVMLGFSVVASLGIATFTLWTGAPPEWARLGDLLLFAALIWAFLVIGMAVQYAICFREKVPKAAEPAAAQPAAQ